MGPKAGTPRQPGLVTKARSSGVGIPVVACESGFSPSPEGSLGHRLDASGAPDGQAQPSGRRRRAPSALRSLGSPVQVDLRHTPGRCELGRFGEQARDRHSPTWRARGFRQGRTSSGLSRRPVVAGPCATTISVYEYRLCGVICAINTGRASVQSISAAITGSDYASCLRSADRHLSHPPKCCL